ncbi:hypothetical protein EX895_002124 [Sporisorium graminicola]|uniref:Non-structural maintenance of chromosomes element 1 homolog n=1 Tax=Sporisorium graminicola TaxID=280036 RepID=A0A4U7KW93_9BASI|nr:hypothetical protein EX895_002124 [Sporisorium graminicola]TKY88883.1 hypothetical protein EX895_002124 [Sporisorium graminicola]
MSEHDKHTLARVSWLQSLVSHRIVPVSFAKHLYKRCCSILGAPYDEAAYQAMYDEATKHLSVLDLEIRRLRDQQTGEHMLALVNTKADKLIQGATRYTANEIAFIKKLVEEIFKAKKETYSLPALEAVRLGSKVRTHLTRDATEELLKNLVDHRWIDYSSDGIYTLSTRSLLELRNYLQSEFGEDYYHTCTHCKDLVTLGIGCMNTSRGCTTRYHLHCARNTIGSAVDDDDALYRLSEGFSCPNCKRVWKSRPIGPRALNLNSSDDHDGLFSSQGDRSQADMSISSRRRLVADEDEEEDDEDEAEYGNAAEQSQRHVSAREAAESDADEEEEVEQQQLTQSRSTRVKSEPERTPQQQRSRPRAAALEQEDNSEEEEDVKPRKRVR